MWTIALGVALGLILVPFILLAGKLLLLAVLQLVLLAIPTRRRRPGRPGREPTASPYDDPHDNAPRKPHQSPYGDHWRP